MNERFLIVKLTSIGDVVMATPIARALRQAKPDAYICWAVEYKAAEVLVGNPYIDEVFVWNRKRKTGLRDKAGDIRSLVRRLRKCNFDVAIDAQGLLKSAVVGFTSGARVRVGYSDSAEGSRYLYNRRMDSPQTLSAQQRYLDLLRSVGVESTDVAMDLPLSGEDRGFAEEFYNKSEITGRKVAVMIPATTWVNKHWRVEAWSELIDHIADRYNAVSIILGAKADQKLANNIIGGCRTKPVDAVGCTTWKQAAALVERSDVSFGVCTGLLHASLALQKPTIGIFGPSVWRSFADQPDFIRLTNDMPCSPCNRHPSCDDYPCIWGIKSEEAAEAAAPYLQE